MSADQFERLMATLTEVRDLLTDIAHGRTPRGPQKSEAERARDLEILRSMRRDPGAQEPGDYPTSTTTREEFWRRRDR